MEMEPDVITWICTSVVNDGGGRVCPKTLYAAYQTYYVLRKGSQVPLNKVIFMKLLMRMFPNVRRCRIRKDNRRQKLFLGISYRKRLDDSSSEKIQPLNVTSYLDEKSFVISKTEDTATVALLTDLEANGNFIMKVITFNFITNSWQLKVRDRLINLPDFGISSHFDQTPENLKTILYIVKQARICTGIPIGKRKTIPISVVCENITTTNESSSAIKSMRCNTCLSMLPWLTVGDKCLKCIKNLSKYKSEAKIQCSEITKH